MSLLSIRAKNTFDMHAATVSAVTSAAQIDGPCSLSLPTKVIAVGIEGGVSSVTRDFGSGNVTVLECFAWYGAAHLRYVDLVHQLRATKHPL